MPAINNLLVFPEDEGTGVTSGKEDYNSAGYFGGFATHPSLGDYVANGMNLQNVSGGTFDITAGLAFILYTGSVDVQDGNASTNNITIQTEGSQSIFPDNTSSITITLDHTYQRLWCDGQNWFAERNVTSDSEYKIVKDGSDGAGIINFKTQ